MRDKSKGNSKDLDGRQHLSGSRIITATKFVRCTHSVAVISGNRGGGIQRGYCDERRGAYYRALYDSVPGIVGYLSEHSELRYP